MRKKLPTPDHDAHRSQVLWTLCVAVAVALTALWKMGEPHRFPASEKAQPSLQNVSRTLPLDDGSSRLPEGPHSG